MALEDRGAQHDKVIVDKYMDPAGNYAMTTRDYVVRPYAIGAPMVLTLPPVAEAKGRFYSIIARQATAVNTITVEDRFNDSECWPGDIVLDGKCDRLLMYSDGLAWHALGAAGPGVWPGMDTTPGPGTTQAPTTAPATTLTTAAPQS
jgi:hypothetical protein